MERLEKVKERGNGFKRTYECDIKMIEVTAAWEVWTSGENGHLMEHAQLEC